MMVSSSPFQNTNPFDWPLKSELQSHRSVIPPLTFPADFFDTFFRPFSIGDLGMFRFPFGRFLMLDRGKGMTRYLPILSVIIGLSIAVGTCIVSKQQSKSTAIPVTCRELATEPVNFVGHRVLVSSTGTEVMNGQLVWKLQSPGDPDVIFYFASGRIPDPLPEYIEGDCLAPIRGGPVRVVNCR